MNKKQLESLYDICSYTRAAGSTGEQRMIRKHIEPVIDYTDGYGNYYKRIGSAPTIWASHTDSVHKKNDPVEQVVYIDENESRLFKGEDKMCLGADCGTGVWIMLQMIKAQVPGLYIFHRAEEIGGLGSGWIVDTPEASTGTDQAHWLMDYKHCISFDRFGNNSIITHQGSRRTASDKFAVAFGDLLDMGHEPDDGGTFTDSANYADLIPECTNLSVGYMHQHSNREYQDLTYLLQLTERLIDVGADITKLPAHRDPTQMEYMDWGWGNVSGITSTTFAMDYRYGDNDLLDAIQTYPESVADMLRSGEAFCLDDTELARLIEDRWLDNNRKYG